MGNTVENPHDYWQRGKLVGCLLSVTKELNYKRNKSSELCVLSGDFFMADPF